MPYVAVADILLGQQDQSFDDYSASRPLIQVLHLMPQLMVKAKPLMHADL